MPNRWYILFVLFFCRTAMAFQFQSVAALSPLLIEGYAVSLKTLKCTPAMAAGVSDTLHDTAWIVGLIDANAPATKKRGPYKKKEISN